MKQSRNDPALAVAARLAVARRRGRLCACIAFASMACGPSKRASTHTPSELARRDASDMRGPAMGPSSRWSYRVRPDRDLTELAVEVCWDAASPEAWVNPNVGSQRALVSASVRDAAAADHALRTDGARISTAHLADRSCFDYRVSLTELSRTRDFMGGTSAGSTRIVSSSRWMWRPSQLPNQSRMRVDFELPAGMEVAVPWPAIDGTSASFEVAPSVFEMRSYTVLGQPRRRSFEVAGAELDVVWPDVDFALTDAGLERWLTAAAESVSKLFGHFPRARLQVLVLPAGAWGGDPVVFGMTGRGGGASLVLLVDVEADDEQFVGEWVAVHEMLHLCMPFVQQRDAWFSEGFATYYQQVVRARAGIFPDPEQRGQMHPAIETLAEGVARVAERDGPSLADASARMFETRSFREVYWGGAGVWFELDTSLRAATAGAHGADDLVREIHACCATKPGVWSAEQLVRRSAKIADRWAEGTGERLLELVETRVHRAPLRGPQAALERIAVAEIGPDIRLLGRPEAAVAIRAAIFGPR